MKKITRYSLAILMLPGAVVGAISALAYASFMVGWEIACDAFLWMSDR